MRVHSCERVGKQDLGLGTASAHLDGHRYIVPHRAQGTRKSGPVHSRRTMRESTAASVLTARAKLQACCQRSIGARAEPEKKYRTARSTNAEVYEVEEV
eukprot:3660375-Pyramimonas_sp.AAC.1